MVFDELDVVEVVRPERERTGAERLVGKVMARVLHHEPHVGEPGEVERKLDLRHIRDVDRVRRIAAERARVAHVPESWRDARQALVERPLVGCRVGHARAC